MATKTKTKEMSIEQIDASLRSKSLQEQRTFWTSYSAYLQGETEKEEAAAKEKLKEIDIFKKATNGS